MKRHAWALSLTLLLVPALAAADDAPPPDNAEPPAAAADQPTSGQPAAEAPSGEQPAPQPDGPEAVFGRLDANQDGEIGEDEVPEEQQRFFRRLRRTSDRDGNGRINREEFLAGVAERPLPAPGQPGQAPPPNFDPEQLFRAADRNGDGKLTMDELPEERREALRARFERSDRDGDGVLTKEEFGEMARAFARNMRGQPGQTPPSTGLTDQRPAFGGERLFAAIDADGDGTLSAEEIAGAAEALKKLDADGDGAITRRELGPPAGAPGGAPNRRQAAEGFIRQADRDGDGRLSKEEAAGPLQENFDRLDANADGFLDNAEVMQAFIEVGRAAGGRGLQQRLDAADLNGDGKLSREEAPGFLGQAFDRVDADGDGLLDEQEVRQFLESVQAGGLRRLIETADRDGDGKVSREEAPENIRPFFGRLDANGDGFIDEQEIRDRSQPRPDAGAPPDSQPPAPSDQP